MTSANPPEARAMDLAEFFSASEARVERWRTLNRVAKTLAGTGPRPGAGAEQEPQLLLAELAPLEDLCGYAGWTMPVRAKAALSG